MVNMSDTLDITDPGRASQREACLKSDMLMGIWVVVQPAAGCMDVRA